MIEQLRSTIRELIRQQVTVSVSLGVVREVYDTVCTVELLDDTHLLQGVSMMTMDFEQTGLKLVPAVGSVVGVGVPSEGVTSAFLLAFSELDGVKLQVGESRLEVSKDGFVFNGGELGGLVKVKELESQLNALKGVVDALILVVNGAPVPEVGNGAPSSFQKAMQSAVLGKSTGDFSQLANEKVRM